MIVNSKIFKTYDIRALYPQEINEEVFPDIIKGIYTFFTRRLKKDVLMAGLSHDMRISSPALYEIAKNTLVALGATVYELGLVSTPTYYFALLEKKLDVGIQISASHNPKEYNGVKFAYREGTEIRKISSLSGMNEVKTITLAQDFVSPKEGGKAVIVSDILDREVQAALSTLPSRSIRNFRVAVDPANAMGIVIINHLIKTVPLTLEKINYELDGTFPAHEANPLKFELLRDLQQKVIHTQADLGLAPDGDGDRIFFVDEKGSIVPAKVIASLIASELLASHKGGVIVVDICNTRNIQKACEVGGGKMIISRVGHSIITDVINKEKALFCGESSGHYYYRESGGAENTLRTILIVLEIMTRTKKTLSQLAKEYQASIESGEYNFKFDTATDTAAIMKKIISFYSKGALNTIDGVAVDFPTWRFSIRTSNTEPLMRLNVEGDTESLVREKLSELTNRILSFGAIAK